MPEIYHQGQIANLTKRGRYWQLDWRDGGKRMRRSTGCTSLHDAREAAAGILSRGQTEDEARGLRLSDGLSRIWRERWRHHSSGKPRRGYVEQAIEILGNPYLRDIKYSHLAQLQDAWLQSGVSQATVNRKVIAVRTILGAAVHPWGEIDSAPPAPRLREDDGHRVALTDVQIKQLLELSSSDAWRWLWRFMLHTGCRKGELLYIAETHFWDAFRLDGAKPVVTLTGKGNARQTKKLRHLPLTRDLAAWLRERQEAGAVTPWNISMMKLRTEWDRIRHAMGQQDNAGFVIHSLRHTCATRRIREGMPGPAVQAWLGHSSFATTQRYIRQVGTELDRWTDIGSF